MLQEYVVETGLVKLSQKIARILIRRVVGCRRASGSWLKWRAFALLALSGISQ